MSKSAKPKANEPSTKVRSNIKCSQDRKNKLTGFFCNRQHVYAIIKCEQYHEKWILLIQIPVQTRIHMSNNVFWQGQYHPTQEKTSHREPGTNPWSMHSCESLQLTHFSFYLVSWCFNELWVYWNFKFGGRRRSEYPIFFLKADVISVWISMIDISSGK